MASILSRPQCVNSWSPLSETLVPVSAMTLSVYASGKLKSILLTLFRYLLSLHIPSVIPAEWEYSASNTIVEPCYFVMNNTLLCWTKSKGHWDQATLSLWSALMQKGGILKLQWKVLPLLMELLVVFLTLSFPGLFLQAWINFKPSMYQ